MSARWKRERPSQPDLKHSAAHSPREAKPALSWSPARVQLEHRIVTTTLLVQQVLNGLLDGVYYLLIALGLSLIFSLGGIVNLRAWRLLRHRRLPHGDPRRLHRASAALSSRAGDGRLLGIVIERFLFRPFYRADPMLSLLLTFGLAMVAEQTLRWIYGAAPLSFAIPQGLRGQVSARRFQLFLLPHHPAGCRRAVRGRPLATAAPNRVRPRSAGRRAEPRHGRRARHLARAVHGRGRRARHRACRSGRACCWRRSTPCIRPWARRSSRRPSSWW